MSALVIDASVAVKWFLPEIHHEAARRLVEGTARLLAPDLLFFEVGNALWKCIMRRQATVAEAVIVLEALDSMGLQIYAARDFARGAMAIAARLGRSVYDSVYVAIAIAEECVMVTADRRLYEALSRRLPGRVVWIEDV